MRSKLYVATAIIAASLGVAGAAFADTTTPDAAATSLLSTGVSQMTPVLIAVATGVLGLTVLSFALRKAFGAIRSGGRRI